MASIRTYEGEIRICTSCGQPAYIAGPDEEAEGLWCHFTEQWDGVPCPRFPLASKTIEMDWDEKSLAEVRESYPDTFPHERSGIRHTAI